MLAHNPSSANDYVLAIRGTSDLTEWWDDLTSMLPWAWDAFGGDVGYGFFRIYQTLRMIYPLKGQALTEAAPAGQGELLEAAGSFADQVAEAVRRHAAETQPADRASRRGGARCRSPSSRTASAARWRRSMWRIIH